jgi:hypothetical protein
MYRAVEIKNIAYLKKRVAKMQHAQSLFKEPGCNEDAAKAKVSVNGGGVSLDFFQILFDCSLVSISQQTVDAFFHGIGSAGKNQSFKAGQNAGVCILRTYGAVGIIKIMIVQLL